MPAPIRSAPSSKTACSACIDQDREAQTAANRSHGRLNGATDLGHAESLPRKDANKEKNTENMNKQTQAISNDMGTLAEDARALMVATADVAGEKVGEARKRFAAALESGKEICGPGPRQSGRRRQSHGRGRARASLSSHRRSLWHGGAHRLSRLAPVLPQGRLITRGDPLSPTANADASSRDLPERAN